LERCSGRRRGSGRISTGVGERHSLQGRSGVIASRRASHAGLGRWSRRCSGHADVHVQKRCSCAVKGNLAATACISWPIGWGADIVLASPNACFMDTTSTWAMVAARDTALAYRLPFGHRVERRWCGKDRPDACEEGVRTPGSSTNSSSRSNNEKSAVEWFRR